MLMQQKNTKRNRKKSGEINWAFLGFCLSRQTVPLGTHTCLIYRNQEKKNRLILRFLADGIQKGEKVLCITDSLTRENILDWLRKKIVDISDEDLEKRLLVKTTKSIYYPE